MLLKKKSDTRTVCEERIELSKRLRSTKFIPKIYPDSREKGRIECICYFAGALFGLVKWFEYRWYREISNDRHALLQSICCHPPSVTYNMLSFKQGTLQS